MSDLYVLYVTATGGPVSIGTTPTTLTPAELTTRGWTEAVFQTPTFEQFQADYVWDPVAKAPALRPVPVQIVVSENLRAKIEASIAEIIDVGFPALDSALDALTTARDTTIPAARTTIAPLKTVVVSNVAQVQTQLRNIGNWMDQLLTLDDTILRRCITAVIGVKELASRDIAISRLLLGDFYGNEDALASEAGTDLA